MVDRTPSFVPNPALSASQLADSVTMQLTGVADALTIISIAANPTVNETTPASEIIANALHVLAIRVEELRAAVERIDALARQARGR